MNHRLRWLNLLGVLALIALCVVQWRIQRQLGGRIVQLERVRQEQTLRLEDREKTIHDQNADLDSFRTQLTRANTVLDETAAKLTASEAQAKQLSRERDQLKVSLQEWTDAVRARDERLQQANDRIGQLASRLEETVNKFNGLASDHNALVTKFDELNALYQAASKRLQASTSRAAAQPSTAASAP